MSCLDQQMKITKHWELLFGVFSSANNSLDYFVLVFQSPRDPGVGKRCRLGTHGEFTPCDLDHDSCDLDHDSCDLDHDSCDLDHNSCDLDHDICDFDLKLTLVTLTMTLVTLTLHCEYCELVTLNIMIRVVSVLFT